MLFVLNIGNTNVQYGVYSGGSFEAIESCPTEQFTAEILPHDMPIAFASVVPELNLIFDDYKAVCVTPQLELGLDTSSVDINTVGADRIANSVSLTLGKLPAICIDCGTALTFETVDRNNRFIGGAIAPGRKLLRQALHDHTALLPIIPLSVEAPAVGTSTIDAIAAGVDRGLIGSIKEIVSGIKKELNSESVRLVTVGGDAQFLCNNIPELELGDIDFTMRGIVKIWELNQ